MRSEFSNSIFVFNDGNIEILNAITVLNINIESGHSNQQRKNIALRLDCVLE